MSELRTVSSQLNVVKLVPADKAAASAADDEHEVIPFPSAEEPRTKAEEFNAELKTHKSVLADLPEAAPAAEALLKAEPDAFAEPAEYQAAPAAAAKPAEMPEPAAAEKPATFTPAELKIEDAAEDDFANFSLEPAKPLPLEIAEPEFESELEDFQLEPAAKPAVESAASEETKLDEFSAEEHQAEELELEELKLDEHKSEEHKLEEPEVEEHKPQEPKPLLNIEDFDDEVILPETAAPVTAKAETAEAPASALTTGLQIMKNYQLGEFENPSRLPGKKWSRHRN